MLERLVSNGAKTIIVESPDRFAHHRCKAGCGTELKRVKTGRCEGRKPLAETKPEIVAMAKRLRRKGPERGQRSLRAIAADLAAGGYLNERGAPYSAKSIASMLN